MSTLTLAAARAIAIVISKDVLLPRIAPVLGLRPLHNAHLLTCGFVPIEESRRIRRPSQYETPIIQLISQAVHAPRWVRVGYGIAQDFGKAGLGSTGDRFLMSDAALDAIR